MKRKIWVICLMLVCLACLALALVACEIDLSGFGGNNPSDNGGGSGNGNGNGKEHKHAPKYMVEPRPASCDSDGNIAYYLCEYCDKWFADKECTVEIADKDSVIIPASHRLTAVSAQEANCTTKGSIAYYSCDVCDRWFVDADGKSEIVDKSDIIVPKTHNFVDRKCTICGAFQSTEGLQYVVKGDHSELISLGTAKDTAIYVAEEYKDKPVTYINYGAFDNGDFVDSLYLPGTITRFASSAFNGLINLTNVVIDENNEYFTSEGLSIFNKDKTTLVLLIRSASGSYTIPSGVTTVGDYALNFCSKLEEIIIPNGVTTIGKQAFAYCYAITSLTIPESVRSIGHAAFEGCSSLEVLTFPYVGDWGDGYISFSAIFKYPVGVSNVYVLPESLKTVVVTGGDSIGSAAFYGCETLENVILPDSITTIESYAFYNCSGLKSITIPDGVTLIQNDAFDGCSGFTNVTLPQSVTTIRWGVFYNCNNIESITLPSTGLSHFGYIFGASYSSDNEEYVPASLKTVVINGGESIEYETFLGCRGITSITLPDSLVYIDTRAFCDCTGLTELTIPNGVTSIGRQAFKGCTGLTELTIPNGVTSIGEGVFKGCTGLTEITIPNGVTTIGEEAFKGCTGFESFTIPGNVKSIEKDAFNGCSSLETLTISDGVTTIGEGAFRDCSKLTSVTVPNSVTSIKISAFSGCSNLEIYTAPFVGAYDDASRNGAHLGYIFGSSNYLYNSEYVPASLKTVVITAATEIGYGAFYQCGNIVSISLPDGIASIPYRAFYGCASLVNFSMPSDVTEIGSEAFYGCASLASITIPNVVTTISSNVFYGCSSFTSIKIPSGVTSIDASAFAWCGGLESITVEQGNTKYHSQGNCLIETSTKKLMVGCNNSIIPNTVTSINVYAFNGCSGMTSLTIPSSVTNFSGSAFSGCSGLESITVEQGNTKYYSQNDCVIDTSSKTLVLGCKNSIIPNGVTSIGRGAFSGCSGLTNVVIPNTVTFIQNYAFEGCTGLTSIIIPESVTEITWGMFYGCSNLKSVTIGKNVSSISWGAFYDCVSLTEIIFQGTKAQWDEITLSFNWDYGSGEYTIRCTDGNLSKADYTSGNGQE